MIARTENGRQRKVVLDLAATSGSRITARKVYMLPIENQKSIGGLAI